MKAFKGMIVETFPYSRLVWIKDLEYFDGPLLSEFKSIDYQESDRFLYYWCDCDKVANRWMVLHVSKNLIKQLENREISLDMAIPWCSVDDDVFFVDIAEDQKILQIVKTPVGKVPKCYMPKSDAFLNKKL